MNHFAMQKADWRERFNELLANRETIVTPKIDVEAPACPTQSGREPTVEMVAELNTDNPHDLSFTTTQAVYRVKGGLQSTLKNMDSLKVTLAIERERP